MDPVRLFTEHPASVGETYSEHLAAASGFGLRMMLAGGACLIHAVLPFLFVKTASRTVMALHERMASRGAAPRLMAQGLRAVKS
ncbi:MAG TPA: DUF6356 family protein [Steroidobacteraceae bacterium]|nr:DUF6356 family protein [Steroidobacteraceae bacterium]